MARSLSKYEKAFRADILAQAVEQLRGELRFSRKDLAQAVGEGLDVSMIGKWERGQFSPSPIWRRRLEVFARRRGSYGTAAVFEQPLQAWREVMLTGRDQRLLELFEIILLNQYGRDIRPLERAVEKYARDLRGRRGIHLCSLDQVITWSVWPKKKEREEE